MNLARVWTNLESGRNSSSKVTCQVNSLRQANSPCKLVYLTQIPIQQLLCARYLGVFNKQKFTLFDEEMYVWTTIQNKTKHMEMANLWFSPRFQSNSYHMHVT